MSIECEFRTDSSLACGTTAPYIIVDAIQVCDAKVEEEEEKKEELHLHEIKESFFDFLRKYSRTGEEDSSILQRDGEYLSTSFVFEGEFSKDERAGFAESDISYLRRNKVIKDEYALEAFSCVAVQSHFAIVASNSMRRLKYFKGSPSGKGENGHAR